jgi:hypothetical protein
MVRLAAAARSVGDRGGNFAVPCAAASDVDHSTRPDSPLRRIYVLPQVSIPAFLYGRPLR